MAPSPGPSPSSNGKRNPIAGANRSCSLPASTAAAPFAISDVLGPMTNEPAAIFISTGRGISERATFAALPAWLLPDAATTLGETTKDRNMDRNTSASLEKT